MPRNPPPNARLPPSQTSNAPNGQNQGIRYLGPADAEPNLTLPPIHLAPGEDNNQQPDQVILPMRDGPRSEFYIQDWLYMHRDFQIRAGRGPFQDPNL
ncbi:hypothetical protein FRB90_012416 [Tulasnella sp. 427]|nr:hypothetical protein FRB90_012416 [Tulasnella sp. 427]